jgi:putative ABC transport system permease protein
VVRSGRHVEGATVADEVRGTVDGVVLDAVRSTPGVQAAEPYRRGVAVVVGHDGELVDANPNRAVPIALGWPATDALNPMDVVEGRAPRHAGDVVIDRATQREGRFAVGDSVRVIGASGAQTYHLTGVVTYGGTDDAAGAQVVAFTPGTAARVFGTGERYQAIHVLAAPGVSAATLVERLRTSVPGDEVEVVTGATAAAESRAASGASTQFVDMFLFTFALVALVVGAFVIHNTFSITVAQRTHETAVLRAVGASRRQVRRAVVVEALLTGVFASVLGAVAGVGLAIGLRSVLEAFGMSLPGGAVVVRAGSIVTAVVIGVLVTVASAYLPARRASKVPPVAAMRDVAVEGRRGSRRRAVLGVVVTAAGAAAVVNGLAGGEPNAIGFGALGVFVGVALLGPAIARPFVGLLGAPLARIRGVPGALARDNASRNPKRSAATASALMVGVGLVAMITVFAASARSSLASSFDTAMRGDYIVGTQFGMGGVSPAVAPRIDALPETSAVTPLRFATATVAGGTEDLMAFDPASVAETVDMQVQDGSVRDLGPRDVAVHEDEAAAHRVQVGDTLSMTFPETGRQELRVAAVYATREPLGRYAISLEAFDAHVVSHPDDVILIKNTPGVSMADARRAIERELADYPTAELMTREEFKGDVAAEIDNILNLVYVLLAMALVIAFFGIANTLALSVLERTRELGLMRAVGMARSQLRSTVRLEAVLVALLGTTLGIAIGVGFSTALVHALRDEGIGQFALPVQQLVLIAGVAVVAAVVTATLPARRAARLDVLRAIGES